ncbi:MAG TPA: ATP-binding protein [Acidobacteriota bacterium]|nr:ATP-binding protein [Acidobacteriota bacterium]
MFVNRVSELAWLEKRYQSGKAELVVLYGRRRVGKTELLAKFCASKPDPPYVFFAADQVPEPIQRANFSSVVNDAVFGKGQVQAVYDSWDDLFVVLARQAQTRRLLVVIDEFPYLVAAYPPLISILQRLWDQTLRSSQIMLIVNGSYIGMMEEAVLAYHAPLYGRRTAQYLLEPLGFFDAQTFFRAYAPDDRLRFYAVFGGTPAYLQTIRTEQSLEANIVETILERGSLLYDEVRFVLQQELREPRNYFAVLQAIAAGKTRQNEIKQASGLDSINPYLETLQDLHLIERTVPVTERQPHKSRRGLYRLKDNYFRFWFRFVLPNRSQLERGAKEMVFDTAIRSELDRFCAPVFEEVCRQYFWRAGLDGELAFAPQQIGGWWQANQEVDIVVLSRSHAMLVECKWSRRPVGIDILQGLEAKRLAVTREAGTQKVFFALCSRSGFTDQLIDLAKARDDVFLYDWERMSQLPPPEQQA